MNNYPIDLKNSQCAECKHLGLRIRCKCCAGGYGWPCLAHPPQHVHPGMRACNSFEDD